MWLAGFLIGLTFGLCLHELGHFVIAKFFGFPVDSVNFGRGLHVASFSAGNTKFIFNLIPTGGRVIAFPGVFASRSKLAMFYAGGLIANFAIVAALIVIAKYKFAASSEKLLIGAMVAQLLLIVENFWPRSVRIYGSLHDTDGLQLRKLFGREWGKNIELVRNTYSELLQSYATSDCPAQELYKVPLGRQKLLFLHDTIAGEQVRKLAAIVDDNASWQTFSRPEQLLILDRILSTILISDMTVDFPDWREMLSKWCLKASKLGRDVDAIRDTRTGVLVELGDFSGALEAINDTDPAKLNEFALIVHLVSFARVKFSGRDFEGALSKASEARLKASTLTNPNAYRHLFDRMDREFHSCN
jgi:Peptidase family M50